MRAPNTTFDVYLAGSLPPSAPDVAGLNGFLEDRWEHGDDFVWTSILEVPLGTNLPDAWPGSVSQTTVWVPDRNGDAFTVVFTERERGVRGAEFLRVYLSKGVIVAINVEEADGSPALASITKLIFDQADGFVLSQPAANQARIDVTITDALLSLSDIATNNVSTSKHGFVPKAPNDTTKFLRGDATWAVTPPHDSVRCANSTTQTIANATLTVVTFDTETYDTNGMHSTSSNTGRLTAATAGKYMVQGAVQFAANAVGYRALTIRKNGTTNYAGMNQMTIATVGVACLIHISDFVDLAANDYIEMTCFQTSGGNLNISNQFFGMSLISP